MTLHAVDDIDDAIDATKSFLFPFELGTWLRLAFVVFFIGGGGGGLNGVQNLNSFNDFGGGGGPGSGTGSGVSLTAPLEPVASLPAGVAQVSGPGAPSGVPDELLAGAGLGIVALLGVLLLLVLVYGLVSNFMEFVFTQALIDREIHVRRYFSDHVGNGVRLLVFRLALAFVWLLLGIAVAAAFFFLVLGGEMTDVVVPTVLASTGLLIVAVLGFLFVNGVVSGFTTVFVVPLMIEGDHGIIKGWSRLWASLTAEPKQYLAYLFFSVVLQIGVGIVGAVLGVIAFVVAGIPFGIVGLLLWFGLGGGGLGAIVAVGVVALLFVLVLLVVVSTIQVPLEAFLRYYAMLVMGDVDDDLDPISDVRTGIRS